MIQASSKGNPIELSLYYKDLLPYLLQNLQSPVAAPYLTKLFVDLRKAVFYGNFISLGELIANVTLRLLKPQCDLDLAWEEEDLTKATIRTINLICQKTLKKKPKEHFTSPSFCYSFNLIKLALLSPIKDQKETLVRDCLQVISEHCKLRGQNLEKLDLYHPKYLPRQQMFEVLVELISKFLLPVNWNLIKDKIY